MKKNHVLLIDDDLDEFEFFVMALDRMPSLFRCTYAASAEVGMRLLDDFIPDFIFVDMNMPRRNGLECIKEIRKRCVFNDIPIILYSTSIDENMETQAKLLGVTHCLKKPIKPDVLEKFLWQMLHIQVGSINANPKIQLTV